MHKPCPTCAHYGEVRRPVLHPEVVKRSQATGESTREIYTRVMAGVHARHLSGKPILPSAR